MNAREVTSGAAAKLPMTFACGLYDRMLRLYTGEVRPDGIDLQFLANDEPQYMVEQHFIANRIAIEELFVAGR